MRFNFQIGKKEEPENDAEESSDVMVNQIANLEEQVNGKTKELAETEQQLKELSNTLSPEEEVSPRPHGPIGELTVEPGDIVGEEVDTSALFEGDDDDGGPVVEVIKAETPATAIEAAVTEATVTEAAPQTPPAAADNSLSSFFGEEEEEENPLATLIEAMPDVTPQELLDDLNEIHNIIKDWQH